MNIPGNRLDEVPTHELELPPTSAHDQFPAAVNNRQRAAESKDPLVESEPAPSLDLHLKVRTAFVSKGTSLRGWCVENGVPPQNARDVLIGRWNGPKGQALRRRLLKAAGLSASA
ncbi:TPA: hypothetical protein ACG4O9_000831 [Stenotrophomonas maltophilia]